MGARQKLNDLYVTVILIMAALVGLLTSSWVAFLATMFVLINIGYLGGAVRTAGRHHCGRSVGQGPD